MDSQPPTNSLVPGNEGAGRLAELMAGYLLASGWVTCPGVDGLLVDDVVGRFYLAATTGGRVPSPPELTVRHPDLADAITVFFERYGSPN